MADTAGATAADVALVHDFLTQRGGAERVVLELADALPGVPIHTSLYSPAGTFPGFAGREIVTLPLDRVALFRDHHRWAFPFLAPAFSGLRLDEPVVLCSSTGWAHGVRATGRKVVYCHSPARWLYQTDRYLGERYRFARRPFELAAVPLRRWDRRAAASAVRYLVNSSAVRERVQATYGIDAEVLPPPPGLSSEGPVSPIAGIDAGFVLCVSRLLEYKNVAAVVEAFTRIPGERLVVAGTGPLLDPLRRVAPKNVVLVGRVEEAELRWLYRECVAVVAASYEDFGLTPLEGLAFGKPTAALRWGGYLDTVRDGETGTFFDAPTPALIATAVEHARDGDFSAADLTAQSERFSRRRFAERVRAVVDEERELSEG